MAKSGVSSLLDLYNSIAAAHFGGERPQIFLGQAPPTKADASQQRVPFTVLFDEGFRPDFESDHGGAELGVIRLEVFAFDLDAATGVSVDSIVRAIKWGGQAPENRAGFDWGQFSLEVGSRYEPVHLRRVFEQRSYTGWQIDRPGEPTRSPARVHKCELRYEVLLGILSS